MEENFEELGHTLQGPHFFAGWDMPAGFVPLHLEVQPTQQRIQISRPDVVLGRHSEADVRLAFPDVSRRHCRLLFRDRQWRVLDLNSLNGIFINGERVVEAVLYEGDQVKIGSVVLIVQGSLCVRPEPKNEVLKSIAQVLPAPRRAG